MSQALSRYFIRSLIGILLLGGLFSYWPGNAEGQSKQKQIDDKNLTIIFDLGGVLFQNNKSRSFWHLGPKALLQYWRHKSISGPTIKRSFYALLDKIADVQGNPFNVCDFDGEQLPLLMVQWLTGEKSCYTIRHQIHTALKQHPEWCDHKTECLLLHNMASMIFTPEKFVSTLNPIPEMVQFAKQCKAKGHRLYLLSNFDPESFALLVEKYPDIFSTFDGMIVSGYVQDVKPNSSIFSYFTDQFEPQRCIFIDDQQENIQAAQNLGMHGIQCKKASSRWSNKVNIALVNAKLLRLEHQFIQACDASCA